MKNFKRTIAIALFSFIFLAFFSPVSFSAFEEGGFWKLTGTTLEPADAGWTVDIGGGSGAPTDATYITQTANGDLSAEQALGDLATGILKNTTATGVLSIAAAGTDYVTAASTNTFTNKTFDANGTGNSISNVETADIASGSKSGADATLITGTEGTSGNIASWNVDGDLVDGSLAVANIIDTSDTATTSTSGISELALASEVTTGTDTGRTITPSALAQSEYGRRIQTVPVLGTLEQCSVGDGAGGIAFRIPAELNGWNLVAVGFGVTTAGTTGNFDIQIRNATKAVDMLTTKMRVETGETDTITSAQPGTINTSNDDVSTGDKIFFDIDACQTTPAYGAIVSLS